MCKLETLHNQGYLWILKTEAKLRLLKQSEGVVSNNLENNGILYKWSHCGFELAVVLKSSHHLNHECGRLNMFSS